MIVEEEDSWMFAEVIDHGTRTRGVSMIKFAGNERFSHLIVWCSIFLFRGSVITRVLDLDV